MVLFEDLQAVLDCEMSVKLPVGEEILSTSDTENHRKVVDLSEGQTPVTTGIRKQVPETAEELTPGVKYVAAGARPDIKQPTKP